MLETYRNLGGPNVGEAMAGLTHIASTDIKEHESATATPQAVPDTDPSGSSRCATFHALVLVAIGSRHLYWLLGLRGL
jgi:hypothetical protein